MKINYTGMIGKYFHSIDDARINWQGVVIGEPQGGWYLVQLFEWLMGEESSMRLVKIEDMAGWIFYPDVESMRESYAHGEARPDGKWGSGKPLAPTGKTCEIPK